VPSYASRIDIETLYGAAHLETLVAAELDIDTAVARACAAASAEIDLYLGQRYGLPLANVPVVVVNWTVDLACWRLAPNAAQNSAETAKRADRIMAMLKDIAAGRSRIPELEPPPSGGASAGGAPGGFGGGIPSGEQSEAAQGGAAFMSDRRRYGQGGGL
jgi:phage gp36-like protein